MAQPVNKTTKKKKTATNKMPQTMLTSGPQTPSAAGTYPTGQAPNEDNSAELHSGMYLTTQTFQLAYP